MTSSKQALANRRNAKRSTGPKTETGKFRSRSNAWKHGLSAQSIVIADENQKDFDSLREALFLDFSPTTTVQAALVERLAGLLWRSRRIPSFEAALISALCKDDKFDTEAFQRRLFEESEAKKRRELDKLIRERFLLKHDASLPAEDPLPPPLEEAEPPLDSNDEKQITFEDIGLALIGDSNGNDVFAKLSRYEASLSNQIAKTLQMLFSLAAKQVEPDTNTGVAKG